jgi:CSLREA domain-containing protein
MRWTVILSVLLLVVSAVHGDTFLVTTSADTNDGACDQNCSLREAVIAANSNPGLDRITLPAGTYVLAIAGTGEDLSATGDLDARDDLEIYGAGAATTIIDANGIDRVFHAYSSDVRIVGVTFRGGSADLGGGIFSWAYVLWLTSVTVSGNHATLDGGGIYTDYETVLTDSIVSGNTADRDGGGIYNGDVAFIRNSTIRSNTAGGAGGGIWNDLRFEVDDSAISGNQATSIGGGIYNSGDLTVRNSTIGGNTGTKGGGIYNENGIVEVSSTTIHDNAATAQNQGTVVYLSAIEGVSGVDFTNSILSGVDACWTTGGALISHGGNLESPGNTCALGAGTNDQTSVSPANLALGSLADNGGPTFSYMPQAGSYAVDMGNPTQCPQFPADQRGAPRVDGACDSGSIEVGADPPFFADDFESRSTDLWSAVVSP